MPAASSRMRRRARGAGVDQLGDLALADQRGRLRAGRGVGEEHGDVAGARLAAVGAVGRAGLAGDAADDLELVVVVEAGGRPAVAVVEGERDLGVVARRPGARAVEDHVVHAVAAHDAGAVLAHHPAQRLEQVRLAAAVRADDAGQARGDDELGRVDEALEPEEAQAGEVHASESLRLSGGKIPGSRRRLSMDFTAYGSGVGRRLALDVGGLDAGGGFGLCLSARTRGGAPMAYDYDDQNVFARILRGEIPNATVLETEHTLAFRDIRAAGAGARAGDPEGPLTSTSTISAPRRATRRSLDFTRAVARLCAELDVAPGDGRRRLPADRQRRRRTGCRRCRTCTCTSSAAERSGGCCRGEARRDAGRTAAGPAIGGCGAGPAS